MTINRDMPAELVELMTAALAGGNIDDVSLVFEGMGYDFYAPIGWFLYMTKVAPELKFATTPPNAIDDDPSILLVCAQVNSPEPTAYLGTDPLGGEPRYWNAEEIAAWIEAPRDVQSAGSQVAIPSDHVEMAIAAAKLGWSVTQQINRYGFHSASGQALPDIPAAVSYRFTAHNYAYADMAEKRHCDTSDDLSLSFALGTSDRGSPWNYGLRGAEKTDPMHIVAAVGQTPPWHAPVAYFDNAAGEWVL